jgi:hypothetical protein
MQNPHVLTGSQRRHRKAGGRVEPRCPLVDVAGGVPNGAGHEATCARGLAVLVSVDQHMKMQSCLDRRDRVADAPPWRQAAPPAASGPGENDAATHGWFRALALLACWSLTAAID